MLTGSLQGSFMKKFVSIGSHDQELRQPNQVPEPGQNSRRSYDGSGIPVTSTQSLEAMNMTYHSLERSCL